MNSQREVKPATGLQSFPALLRIALSKAFLETYPPDEFDAVHFTYHEKAVQNLNGWGNVRKADYDYLTSPLTMLASFLGISNKDKDTTEKHSPKQSFANIFRNIFSFGYNREDSAARNVWNVTKNIVSKLFWPIKLAFNILKIGTELIWAVGARVCDFTALYAVENAKRQINSWNESKSPGANTLKAGLFGVLYGAALGLGSIFKIGHFIGSAYFSPGNNVRRAIMAGYALGKGLEKILIKRLGPERAKTIGRIVGKVASSIFAFTGIALTIALYTFTFPVALKVAGPIVLKTIASNAPAIASGLLAAGQWIVAAGKTLFGPLNALLVPASKTLGLAALEPTAAGIGVIAGAGAAVYAGYKSVTDKVIQKSWKGVWTSIASERKAVARTANVFFPSPNVPARGPLSMDQRKPLSTDAYVRSNSPKAVTSAAYSAFGERTSMEGTGKSSTQASSIEDVGRKAGKEEDTEEVTKDTSRPSTSRSP